MRLDKFISDQVGVSRSRAKELIRNGSVSVGGINRISDDTKIDPEKDEIFVNSIQILYRQYLYIMLNKPAGTICAVKDRLSPTVLELLPPPLRRKGLFPAGRLDKDTEGFVFITDDGALAHRMLSPKSHVEKEYEVTLEKPAQSCYKGLFAAGLTIDGGEKCLPADITFTDDPHVVRLVICEGKYHQVKRMAQAVGNSVIHLKRVRIGGIHLDPSLAPGECREIMHKEVEEICAKKR